jgi:phage terminase large subunit-like protein
MSEKLDLTAGVVALRVDDDDRDAGDTIELAEMVGDQEVKKTLDLNFCVELIPFFWLPEDTLRERVRQERIPFDVWARTPSAALPYLRVTPGPVVDHDLIYEQVMKEIVPAYRPQRIGYDPWNATQFAVSLRDRGKQTVVEVKQGRALSETIKLFEALVRLKRIRHAGSPVLSWCLSNAEPSYDRWRNVSLSKPAGSKRIDGIIASLIALSQLVLLPARVKRRSKRPTIHSADGVRYADTGDLVPVGSEVRV